MVPAGLTPCLGQRTLLIRPEHRQIDATYLTDLLLSPHVQTSIHARTNGATVAHLNMKDVRELELPPLPPRGEQRRVAGILLAYDELIENCERRIRVLDEMARALYREWFVLFRYPGHEKTPLVDSPLGRIPQEWNVATIGEVCADISYGYTTRAEVGSGGLKFLRITDIVPELIDWDGVPGCSEDPVDAEKYLLKEGDIVVARTGATVGYAKRLHRRHPKSVFASYLVRLRVNSATASDRMLGVLMQSPEYKSFVKRNAGGAAQPNANAKVLTSMQFANPPRRISLAFDELVEPVLEHTETIASKARVLRKTRDLLLPRLLSGQLSVEDVV
jgi:type I restriction enzyme, S subunit